MAREREELEPTAPSGQEVVLLGGAPASGKSTLARWFVERGHQQLSRDRVGGRVDDLLPELERLLSEGRSAVLDNLYPTRASRAGAVAVAARRGVPVRFVGMATSLEEAQFNACVRMIERCGKVLEPSDHKLPAYKADPNLFPVAALYKYRKELEEPSPAEGLASIERIRFVRRKPADWVNQAVIFDFDGTLRTHEGPQKYPTHPSEVRAMTARAGRIREWAARGYRLLGASNQSGVAKGTVTAERVEACFAETLRQMDLSFDEVRYCPHKIPPITCYCRKPGPGMGVELIAKYKLDPERCYYVGDMATDRSFAERCGFRFVDHAEFFA